MEETEHSSIVNFRIGAEQIEKKSDKANFS